MSLRPAPSSPYSWTNLTQISADHVENRVPDIDPHKYQAQKGDWVYHPTKPLAAHRKTSNGGQVDVYALDKDRKPNRSPLYRLRLPHRLAHACFGFAVLWVDNLLVVGVPRADVAVPGERYWRTDTGVVTIWRDGMLLETYTCNADYTNSAMFGRMLWLEEQTLKTNWTFRTQTPVGRGYAEGVIPYQHLLDRKNHDTTSVVGGSCETMASSRQVDYGWSGLRPLSPLEEL